MRHLIIAVFLLTVPVSFSGAQTHPNGVAGVVESDGRVYLFNRSTVTSLLPAAGSAYGCVMDRTNSLLLVTSFSGKIFKVDPATAAISGTLTTLVAMPLDIVIDHNGDHYVNNATGVWKFGPLGGPLTTVATGLPDVTGGMTIDVDTGDLILQGSLHPSGGTLFRVARDGSSVASLGTGADPRHGITQHIPTGDIYIGSCCGDLFPQNSIYVLKKGTPTATIFMGTFTPPVGCYSLKADRSSAATQQLLVGAFRPSNPVRGPGGWYMIDLSSRTATRLSTVNASFSECEFLYRRNVFGIRTTTGKWDLGVAIPEDKEKPFVLAVSASGVRPGLPLGDGRTVRLSADVLTTVSVQGGGIPPILTGTTGALDTYGRATAKLDLSSFSAALNGQPLYFVAVTLDPAASLGIRTITDPFVLRIEGL